MSGKRSINDFFRPPASAPPPKRARTSSPQPLRPKSEIHQGDAEDSDLARAIALSLKDSLPSTTSVDHDYGSINKEFDPAEQQQPFLSPSYHPSYPHPIANVPISMSVNLQQLPVGSPTALSSLQTGPLAHRNDLDGLFYHHLIPRADSMALFKFLRAELPFYRVAYDINRFGKTTRINTPRYTTVFGVDDSCRFADGLQAPGSPDATQADTLRLVSSKDPSVAVSPSSYQRPPRPVPACLSVLKEAIERVTAEQYNFILVNYYADGNDSISYHSDDERFLGEHPAIASLSLGAVRDFCLKPKDAPVANGDQQKDKSKPGERVIKIPLESGDMVLMRGLTQSRWLHAVPKRKGDMGKSGRINITFRRALVREGTNNYYRYNVGDGEVWRWDHTQKAMVEWKETKPRLG